MGPITLQVIKRGPIRGTLKGRAVVGDVMMGTEVRVKQGRGLQAKEYRQPLEVGKGAEIDSPLEPSERSQDH